MTENGACIGGVCMCTLCFVSYSMSALSRVAEQEAAVHDNVLQANQSTFCKKNTANSQS
jgi:hypothetical protein